MASKPIFASMNNILKHLNQSYLGWELYWCVAVTIVVIILSSLYAWKSHKALREKDKIIEWNLQERISLEETIEQNNDSIKSLREKVRYYKNLSKNKTYRK